MNNSKRLEQIVAEISKKGDVRPVLQSRSYSNVYASGKFIYSYGNHFIMATLIGKTWLVNTDRYSQSTGRQLQLLRRALQAQGVPRERVIFTPIDADSKEPNAILTSCIRLCDREIQGIAEKLTKTRAGSGNNIYLTSQKEAFEESLKRMVVLREMTLGGRR